MTPADVPSWVRELFQQLAQPRLAGTVGNRAAREHVHRQLEVWGYDGRSEPFTTSSRRLAAITIGGVGLGWIALGVVPLVSLPLPRVASSIVVILLPILAAILTIGLARGWLPLEATTIPCVNLVAVRGTPKRWLVAHIDTKAQPLSLLWRVVATGLVLVGVAIVLGLGLARLAGPLPWSLALPAAIPALVGGAMLSRNTLHDTSPGAVDNASGVVAALVAAEMLKDEEHIGVLITDGEELGMEGARAWLGSTRPSAVFVNFDGLDDRGPYRLTVHGPEGERLARALGNELVRYGHAAPRRSLPLAIPVDGLILARGGHRGVTVSRGDLTTASVVHTRRDAAGRLQLRSAVDAGRAAAAILRSPIG